MILNAEVVRVNIRDLALKFLFKNTREQEKFRELYENELSSARKGIPGEAADEDGSSKKTKIDEKVMFDPDLE
jgi:hypothetical protein